MIAIWHQIMHILTIALALALTVISLVSYVRTRKTKFLLIAAAFLVLAVKDTLLAVLTFQAGDDPTTLPLHVLEFAVVVLFALGVLK